MQKQFRTPSRRGFLQAATTLTAAAVITRPNAARAQISPLPPRGEFVVRNANVLTMDASLGDYERADVHVRAGTIIGVGPDLSAPTAEVVDGRNMIALPGLADTHNHLWTSTWRNLAKEGPEKGYFPTTLALGKECTPDDMYRSVRLGLAELIYSGITLVNDWAHNMRGPAYADAEVRALQEAGIRGRLSYGTLQGGPAPDQTMDLADLGRMHRDWNSNEGLLTLGMASRSVSASPRGAVGLDVLKRDWAGARALGLPITMHTGGGGTIAILDREKLLGPDVQLVHPGAWTEADLATVVRTGAHVSMSPLSEMRALLPPLYELLKLGVKPSLSMDSASVIGTNNMFATMSVTLNTQSFRTKDPLAVSARQLLEMATINGAWDMGVADKVGSLTPGKRADLILVRTDDINIAPLGDPVTAIVRSAQPYNVDTVVIDGRILKRGGKLTAFDIAAVTREAAQSLAELKKRAGWS